MLIRVLYVSPRLNKTIDIDLTERQLIKFLAAGSFSIATGNPTPVLAATVSSVGISSKVAAASQPIKDLLIGIADPVCYLVFTWGLLECMLGKASSGVTRMKFAALGYAGMNWLPVLMQILREARP